jgi:predicted transglutaminase-like cysteine proteinase
MVSLQNKRLHALSVISLAMLMLGIARPAHGQMIRMDGIAMANAARAAEPFGRATSFAPAGPLWIKWQEMDEEFAKADRTLAQCRDDQAACPPAIAPLAALVEEAHPLEGRHRLAVVNRAINLAIAYTSDERQFGNGADSDVWSGPAATFASGRGDCEDYAIAKMFALRAAGVPKEDLRLLVVRVSASREGHALLAARADGQWLILDNRTMLLVDDIHERGVTPMFSLDASGVRQYGAAEVTMTAAEPPATVYPYEPLWLAM